MIEIFGESNSIHFNNNRKTSFISKELFEKDKEIGQIFTLREQKIKNEQNIIELLDESSYFIKPSREIQKNAESQKELKIEKPKRKISTDIEPPNKRIHTQEIEFQTFPENNSNHQQTNSLSLFENFLYEINSVNSFVLMEPKINFDQIFKTKLF